MDPKALPAACLAIALALLPACSDSSSDSAKDIVPDKGYGTSSLDALSPEGTEKPAPESAEQEPVVIDQGADGEPREDEDREWTRERESKSLLGRSRDKAKELRTEMQGGTSPENGLADTTAEDEWVGTSGVVWDMPEDWRMAVPSGDRIGEMYVQSPFGAASVAFTKESATVAELERQVSSMLVDQIGGKVKPRTESFDVLGRPVKTLALEGTYVDPSAKSATNEKPFYAVRGAIVDLGDLRVLIVMWGPEDTVRAAEGKFEAMIKDMKEE